jgi:hypothetical protein
MNLSPQMIRGKFGPVEKAGWKNDVSIRQKPLSDRSPHTEKTKTARNSREGEFFHRSKQR